MDVSAIILNKLLTEKNVDLWAKLKLAYIDPAFTSLYSAVGKYYDKYSAVPSFEELDLTLREGPARRTLAIVKLADSTDIPVEVVFDALVDQYTQKETINQLDKFLDKVTVYDSTEIKENLANIVLYLDEKTLSSESVVTSSDLLIFQDPEDVTKDRVPLGLNNDFDAFIGNCAREEVVLIGGKRGSGKSITCSNIQANEYEAGFVCPYFTIEMTAKEVFQRNLAILSGVEHGSIKKQIFTDEEKMSLALTRAKMFKDYDAPLKDFMAHKNLVRLERELTRSCTPIDNPLIIIDDRKLSLNAIDLHLGKLKAKYGDKMRIAVVDYVNQIVIENRDMYDWKPQIEVSKGLKNLARKHQILLVSPYQIDASGEARFAKGILDSCDIALTLSVEGDTITMDTTKIRGAGEMKATSGINWKTLRISPISVQPPPKEEKEDKPKRGSKKVTEVSIEKASDTPPWEA